MFVQLAALGKMPFYIGGVASEVVGIDDVADAMLRASHRGRVGERRPRAGILMALLHGLGRLADAAAALLRRDIFISRQGARLLALTSLASHAKATRELGWHPKPTEHFIRRAAEHYVSRST